MSIREAMYVRDDEAKELHTNGAQLRVWSEKWNTWFAINLSPEDARAPGYRVITYAVKS